MHSPPAASPYNTGSTFRSRLFTYSVGLAIGCVMTGALISARWKAARAEAERTQAEAAAAKAEGLAAPAPGN